MLIRKYMGDEFDELVAEGKGAKFLGAEVGSASREELLSVIGWLGRDAIRRQIDHTNTIKFLTDVDRAKGG